MDNFIVDAGNGQGLFGFFEDDGETGYFYLYEPNGRGVIDHLRVYQKSRNFEVQENDVKVVWSANNEKCGVTVWGHFYGIFDLSRNKKISSVLENPDSAPIVDQNFLEGFEKSEFENNAFPNPENREKT